VAIQKYLQQSIIRQYQEGDQLTGFQTWKWPATQGVGE